MTSQSSPTRVEVETEKFNINIQAERRNVRIAPIPPTPPSLPSQPMTVDLAAHKLDGYDEFMDLIKCNVPIGSKKTKTISKGYYEGTKKKGRV